MSIDWTVPESTTHLASKVSYRHRADQDDAETDECCHCVQ